MGIFSFLLMLYQIIFIFDQIQAEIVPPKCNHCPITVFQQTGGVFEENKQMNSVGKQVLRQRPTSYTGPEPPGTQVHEVISPAHSQSL